MHTPIDDVIDGTFFARADIFSLIFEIPKFEDIVEG